MGEMGAQRGEQLEGRIEVEHELGEQLEDQWEDGEQGLELELRAISRYTLGGHRIHVVDAFLACWVIEMLQHDL